MLKQRDIKTFKKSNKGGDVMGVVRTLYPDIEIETLLEKNRKKNNA